MRKLNHVLRYLIQNYPHKSDLSKTRITKMVYLADWYSTLSRDKQITNIQWYFDHYGPYVPDVYEAALNDKYLKIKEVESYYGTPKNLILLNEKYQVPKINLNKDEIFILNKVIENTKSLTWNAFIKMVYDTYPIKRGNQYEPLDLIKFAKDYKTLIQEDTE